MFKYNIKTKKMYLYDIIEKDNYFVSTSGIQGGILTDTRLKADTQGKVNTILNKKKKSGYRDTEEEAKISASILLKENVQLIGNYDTMSNRIVYPCYASIKLDGISGHTMGLGYDVYSRRGNHLFKSDKALVPWSQFELYKPGVSLADIVHTLHTDPQSLDVRYFDLKEPPLSFTDRLSTLRFFTKNTVNHERIDNEEELNTFYKSAVDSGEEGIVIMNADEKYVGGTRSTLSMKWKPKNTEEFTIIDVYSEVDMDTGKSMALFKVTDGSKIFKVRTRGTKKDRMKMWFDREDLIKKMLTVEFRGFTKYGVPFHPIGISVRDYE